MRAIFLLAGLLALLAPAAAHAKGAPVAAAEACDAAGCRPAEAGPDLAVLVPDIAMAAADGTRYVAAPHATPYVRIRLWLDEPHTPELLRHGDLDRTRTVEIDYAPSIAAVRPLGRGRKPHWAGVDGLTLRTLERMTVGLVPARRIVDRSEPIDPPDRSGPGAERRGDGQPLAAGFAVLGLAGLAAGIARRRLR